MNSFQRNTLHLLSLILGVAVSGCTQSQRPDDGTRASAPVQLSPVVVDLGEIESSLEVQTFSFELKNVSHEPIRVEISAGCGCTALDQTKGLIPPGASHRVTASLSLRGRLGDFHSSIQVDSRSGDASRLNQTASLPIHAFIVDLWRAVPQRLIFENGGEGTVSVSAPTAEWVGVSAERIGQGFDFEQTATTTQGSVETRVFRVTTNLAENHGGNCGIGFRHEGAGNTVFTVPVLIQ